MDLTTRCPECGTTFAASLAQLQLRKGYIRCVNCAHIFDGYEAVVPGSKPVARQAGEPPRNTSAVPAATRVAPEPVVPAPGVVRQRQTPQAPSNDTFRIPAGEPQAVSSAETRFTLGAASPAGFSAEPSLQPQVAVRRRRHDAQDSEDEQADPEYGLYIEPRSVDANDTLPVFLREPDHVGGGIMRAVWAVLFMLGMVLAAAQLVYVYRLQIAAAFPVVRPYLVQLCQPLHCTVPYARQIDHILITSSSLRSGSRSVSVKPSADSPASADGNQAPSGSGKPDPDNPGTLVLGVVLRNTYDQPQEWPVLVLSLTDFSGTRVARKNIAPAQYLGADQLGRPFPAGAEAEISVPLELKGIQINGYQLDKFFP